MLTFPNNPVDNHLGVCDVFSPIMAPNASLEELDTRPTKLPAVASIYVETTEAFIQQAKDALRKAGMKIPSPCKVSVGKAS